MAHLKLDRIAGTTASTGTGALTLDATAVDGYSRFQDVMSNGDTMHVMVVDRTTGNYQGGVYTYSAGTLTLTTLLSSTTGGQINFAAGTKDLFDYAPASKAIVEDNNGDVIITRDATIGRNLAVAGAGAFDGNVSAINPADAEIRFYFGNTNRSYFWGTPASSDTPVGRARLVDNVAGAERITVSTGGNVGIGQVNPAYKFDVNGGGINIDSGGDTYGLIRFLNSQRAYYWQITPSTDAPGGRMRLYDETGAAERITVLSGGNVGIGQTNPSYNLDVNGTARFVGNVALGTIQAPSGNLNLYAGAASTLVWGINGTAVVFLNSGSFFPTTDNVTTNGGPSNRWATIYAGTGIINTSDEADKTNIRTLTDAETAVAVALASKVQLWQWKDAIAKKGVDAARLHVSLTAQVVRDTFIAGGLEPFRYGCVGFDALTKTESYTETVQRPKTQTVDAQEQSVEIVNGVPTLVTKTVQRSQPVGALVPVVDGNGQPVTVQTGTDAAGRPVMGPMLHFVPEMESVEETRTRTVPDLDASGQPVLRMNVRPDQLAMWIAHGVAHRLAALEAKVG
jgi:hypothetical protein